MRSTNLCLKLCFYSNKMEKKYFQSLGFQNNLETLFYFLPLMYNFNISFILCI